MSRPLIADSDALLTVRLQGSQPRTEEQMRTRITTAVAPIAAIAALAVGGVAHASSGGAAAHHARARTTATMEQPQSGPDTDNVQSGSQTAPDTGSSAEPGSEPSGETG